MQSRTPATDNDDTTESERPTVRACESCPGRTVLLESDNADGWIASELVVDVQQYR